jgi:hypothetical protein
MVALHRHAQLQLLVLVLVLVLATTTRVIEDNNMLYNSKQQHAP